MNRPPSRFDSIRFGLAIVLVFFVAVLFSGLILGPIITLLFFLFMRYYRRSKELERRLAELTNARAGEPQLLPGSTIPPPPPTDA